MSRRNSSAVIGSVHSRLLTISALDSPASKSRNLATSPRMRSTHSATTSRGFSTRSADLPLGSPISPVARSEEHTSELQSRRDLVCRLLLEKKKTNKDSREH